MREGGEVDRLVMHLFDDAVSTSEVLKHHMK
jgi:hypothetical protein